MMQRGLQCIQHLVSCDWLHQQQPLLRDFLRAFVAQSEQNNLGGSGALSAAQVSNHRDVPYCL